MKLKPVDQLICPKCGMNSPIMKVNIEELLIPVGMTNMLDCDMYEVQHYNSYDTMHQIDTAILRGEAKCECALCHTPIKYYYEEDGENETECNRSTK